MGLRSVPITFADGMHKLAIVRNEGRDMTAENEGIVTETQDPEGVIPKSIAQIPVPVPISSTLWTPPGKSLIGAKPDFPSNVKRKR
jgi:hypothetical protein